MSAREVLGGALMAALDGLTGAAVFDAPPVRASLPYALIAEPELRAIDAATITGRQARIVVEVFDAGERPVRLRALQDEVEARVLGIAGDLGGEGWRLVSVALARSRIARAGDARWRGASEFLAIIYRADS